MFPGALQIFQNALQSGNEESAKKFIHDLEIVSFFNSTEWSIRSTKYLRPRALRTPDCVHSGVVTIEASVDCNE